MTSASGARRSIRPLGALLAVASLLALEAGPALLDGLRGAEPGAGVVCSFRAATGQPCLACGGTRALARMARGDWRGAIRANPLGAFCGLSLWLLAVAGALAGLSESRRPLTLSLGLLLALTPGAFAWNLVSWLQALPPGSLRH